MTESPIKSQNKWFISVIKCWLCLFTELSVYCLFKPLKTLFLRLCSTTMSIDWNSRY